MLQELEVLLPRLNAVIGSNDFDLSTSQQRFRVTGTDYAAAVIVSGAKFKDKRFSLDEYLRRPHAVVATAEGQQTMIDPPLADLGKARNVVLQSSYFMATTLNIVGTDVIFTVPMRIALELSKLANFRQVLPPQEISDFLYTIIWHPRLGGDSGHAWFRDQIRTTVTQW